MQNRHLIKKRDDIGSSIRPADINGQRVKMIIDGIDTPKTVPTNL